MAEVLQGGEEARKNVRGLAGEVEAMPGRSGHGLALMSESKRRVTDN